MNKKEKESRCQCKLWVHQLWAVPLCFVVEIWFNINTKEQLNELTMKEASYIWLVCKWGFSKFVAEIDLSYFRHIQWTIIVATQLQLFLPTQTGVHWTPQIPRYIWGLWLKSGLVWGWILQFFRYFTFFKPFYVWTLPYCDFV